MRFAAGLRFFLAPRHRDGQVRVACDGVSSLGHVVESLGVPRPEVGSLVVNGTPVMPSYRLAVGDVAIRSDDEDELAAHATVTYSIPPRGIETSSV